jgi:hypothetical protein
MKTSITGSFDVELTPDGEPDDGAGARLGRMRIAKQYHGELDAVASGTMLSAITDTPGSAAYVAVERVTGTLADRRGSFVLQHAGTMHAGDQSLTVSVVPASGSDDLDGLRGDLVIRIEDGQHFYDFTYWFE